MSIPECPFRCAFLQALYSLGAALLFPSYWSIDRLLSCVVLTSVDRCQGPVLRVLLLLLGVPIFVLLFVLSLVPGLFGFLLWAPLQAARRPYSYQKWRKTGDPPQRPLSGDHTFIIVSANLCLLPGGLARFSNMSHSQRRAATISRLLCSAANCQRNGRDSSPLCRPDHVLPDHVLPDHVLPDHVLPDHVLPDHVLSDHVLPDHVLPDHVLPDHVLPDHVLPDHVLPEMELSDHVLSDHVLHDHVLPDHVLPDHVLPDHVLPEMELPDHVLPDHVLPDHVLPEMELPERTEDPLDTQGDPSFRVSLTFPGNTDFICLQEVFDGRASRKLRRCLRATYPHILYDVGPSGPHSSGFRFFNSGLFLASRHPYMAAQYYCFPNSRGEDALAAKGLLCVKVRLGVTAGRQRIVGYINCTHLHAPECDAEVRCAQMSLILRWLSDFQAQFGDEDDLVAFDVLCGDLNFDNCSTDDCREQEHELFSAYRDPCRDCAGCDRLGAVGTLLRMDCIHHTAVSTPASLKRILESERDRKLYLAPPLPEGVAGTGANWTGRRIDYILYKESGDLLPLTVNTFRFITQLAGLSDHVPVSLELTVSLPEVTPL